MARSYNYIYSELVGSKNDILGHIAYALYKSEKIEFIENFKAENHRDPNEEDLKNFHLMTCSAGSIDRFKQSANAILQNFLNDILQQSIQEIQTDATLNQKKYFQEALEEVKPQTLGKSYFHGIMQSVIGAFIFLVLIAALIFALDVNRKGVTVSLGNGSAEIQQTTTKDTLGK
jgi:hypothetical protein